MNQSSLKNMIVLKNLPSNIVEEAIVILKTNKKVKKLEKIEKDKLVKDTENKRKEKDYILREAEMLVSNYISDLEEKKDKKDKKNIKNQKTNQKYTRIRNYACVTSFIILIETMILFMK